MCIRDSDKVIQSVKAVCAGMRIFGDSVFEGMRRQMHSAKASKPQDEKLAARIDSLTAVSYTHLGLKMEEEEFYRFLYWHLKMRDEVQTATCAADKKPYVALKEVDMNRAMSLQITMGVFFLYKVCTKEEQKLSLIHI